LEKSQRENLTLQRILEISRVSPPGKFRLEKSQRENLTLQRILEISRVSPPSWREVVWASLLIRMTIKTSRVTKIRF
jgi:hypothetical protein